MTDNNQIDISNQVISMDKEYVTRDGRKVRILCTDNYKNTEYPVVAIMPNGDVLLFAKNGKYNGISTSSLDLICTETHNKSQFKEGDILIVCVSKDMMKYTRVFSHFDGDGNCCCFDDGKQSGDVTIWKHYRKATEEEIAITFQSFSSL